MHLVLVADHVLADGADKLVILVELKQLRFSRGIALKGEKVLCRIQSHSRDAARQSLRQSKRISECETQIGSALFVTLYDYAGFAYYWSKGWLRGPPAQAGP